MKHKVWTAKEMMANDKQQDSSEKAPGITLIYDGECPFCRNYTRFLRLKESVGPLTLLNAREPHKTVAEIIRNGYDLDQGMVAIINGEIFHADACLNKLALLSTKSRLFRQASALNSSPLFFILFIW